MVISSNPTSSNGLSTWSLNLVRFLLLASTINSVMGCSDKDLRRISTWSRLSPDLVPTWSSACAVGLKKVVVTQCSDTSITGSATPCSRQSSRIRRMPEPMFSTPRPG